MIESNDFPNILIYGPLGSGKKTRIACILRQLYGVAASKTKIELKSIAVNASKKIDVKLVASSHHIELNPSDHHFYDRHVVTELIKVTAQSKNVFDNRFKVIVIHEAHKLTKEAQQALRRTMEKYVKAARVILNADTISTIIPPIQSRSLLIRVALPSRELLVPYLVEIARKENFHISSQIAEKIVDECERNTRKCLLTLETMKVKSKTSEVPRAGYLLCIDSMAEKILSARPQTSIRTTEEIRLQFYQLQMHLIPIELIYINLTRKLKSKLNSNEAKAKLIEMAARYQHNSVLGSKQIIHFEAFIANFLDMYFKQSQ
ncbi:replication factor C subunit 3-like protein [Dinothrombium tinctorium]|uniref:Replication factor C subunit 3-like protein n=1 Tax=Dinothrombium tinctorium TaxID=1965070 RepID=A0A3S3SN02_9ACAR|nr:replication factor C subunit 3-like protein [Dinothrombium tinctorium]